ncbi:MAG TPA: hypothetical protein DIU07_09705 [Rhodobacteraceae bacterium]|nr:hypothetical protein [Paracoccaceae bacterium]
MVPSYDFDIHWLIPRDVEADPAISKLLGDIGLNGKSRGNYIALFRDPKIIAMIERADPVLRDLLKASGFGFIPFQGDAPAGQYPAEDAAARTEVITRLVAQLGQFDLKGADLGGFDFGGFLKSIVDAGPLPDSGAAPDPRMAPTARPSRTALNAEAMPSGFAKLSCRNRVLPFMVLSLAVTLGVYWVIEHIEAAPIVF